MCGLRHATNYYIGNMVQRMKSFSNLRARAGGGRSGGREFAQVRIGTAVREAPFAQSGTRPYGRGAGRAGSNGTILTTVARQGWRRQITTRNWVNGCVGVALRVRDEGGRLRRRRSGRGKSFCCRLRMPGPCRKRPRARGKPVHRLIVGETRELNVRDPRLASTAGTAPFSAPRGHGRGSLH